MLLSLQLKCWRRSVPRSTVKVGNAVRLKVWDRAGAYFKTLADYEDMVAVEDHEHPFGYCFSGRFAAPDMRFFVMTPLFLGRGLQTLEPVGSTNVDVVLRGMQHTAEFASICRLL